MSQRRWADVRGSVLGRRVGVLTASLLVAVVVVLALVGVLVHRDRATTPASILASSGRELPWATSHSFTVGERELLHPQDQATRGDWVQTDDGFVFVDTEELVMSGPCRRTDGGCHPVYFTDGVTTTRVGLGFSSYGTVQVVSDDSGSLAAWPDLTDGKPTYVVLDTSLLGVGDPYVARLKVRGNLYAPLWTSGLDNGRLYVERRNGLAEYKLPEGKSQLKPFRVEDRALGQGFDFELLDAASGTLAFRVYRSNQPQALYVGTSPAAARAVVRADGYEWPSADLSPDGSHVAVTMSNDGLDPKLRVLSAADGFDVGLSVPRRAADGWINWTRGWVDDRTLVIAAVSTHQIADDEHYMCDVLSGDCRLVASAHSRWRLGVPAFVLLVLLCGGLVVLAEVAARVLDGRRPMWTARVSAGVGWVGALGTALWMFGDEWVSDEGAIVETTFSSHALVLAALSLLLTLTWPVARYWTTVAAGALALLGWLAALVLPAAVAVLHHRRAPGLLEPYHDGVSLWMGVSTIWVVVLATLRGWRLALALALTAGFTAYVVSIAVAMSGMD